MLSGKVRGWGLPLSLGGMAQVTGRGFVLGLAFLYLAESQCHEALNSESQDQKNHTV